MRKLAGLCALCGSEVRGKKKSRSRDGKKSKNIFCGMDCYRKHQKKITDDRKNTCVKCGVLFVPSQNSAKYCSWDCRVSDKRVEPNKCVNCLAIFTPVKHHKNRGYTGNSQGKTCSESCQNLWIRNNEERKKKISFAFTGNKHPNWNGGSSSASYRGVGWKAISERVRRRDGYKCQDCGISQDDYGRSLDVHHIIPFHQDGKNQNRLSNLVSLCKTCHMKAEWAYRKNNKMQESLICAS